MSTRTGEQSRIKATAGATAHVLRIRSDGAEINSARVSCTAARIHTVKGFLEAIIPPAEEVLFAVYFDREID